MSTEEAVKYKEENNINFFMETSAKIGDSSKNLFIEAAKLLYTDYMVYSSIKGQSSNNCYKEKDRNHPYGANDRLPSKRNREEEKSFILNKSMNKDKSCSC